MLEVINDDELLGKKVTMYASWNDQYKVFEHIYPSKIQLSMCGVRYPSSIELEVSNDGTYYGWYDNSSGEIEMVYKSILAVSICFPYGVKASIDRGEGKLVKLTAKLIMNTDKTSNII